MKPSQYTSYGNFRRAMKKLQHVEKLYYATEERYVRLKKKNGGEGIEFEKVENELNELGELLEHSEREFWATLDENGSLIAKLVRYWWRSWRRRQF